MGEISVLSLSSSSMRVIFASEVSRVMIISSSTFMGPFPSGVEDRMYSVARAERALIKITIHAMRIFLIITEAIIPL